MIPWLCLCLLSGVFLGTRYRIYALLPASAAATLLAIAVASAGGATLFATLSLIVACPTTLQAGYAAVLLLQLRSASGRPARAALKS